MNRKAVVITAISFMLIAGGVYAFYRYRDPDDVMEIVDRPINVSEP